MKIPYVPHQLIETSPWRLIMNDNLTYTMYRVDNPTVEWVFKKRTTLFQFIADNQIDLQVGDIIVNQHTHQRLGQRETSTTIEEMQKRRRNTPITPPDRH